MDRPRLKVGDLVIFEWELEYIARQTVPVTESLIASAYDERAMLEVLDDTAWDTRVDIDGLIAMSDHNIEGVRIMIIREDEVIYEGTWEDGLRS